MVANIGGYNVHVYSSKNGNPNSLPVGAPGQRALVVLWDAGTPPKTVAWLQFWDAGATIPPEQMQSTIFVGNMPFAALGTVVDLLRNEKPIAWSSITGGSFGVFFTNSIEPVGEGGA